MKDLQRENQMKIKLIKRGVNVCERSVRNWMNDASDLHREKLNEN